MVTEPDKELRFTRSGQALGFCFLGAIAFSALVTLLATNLYRDINPDLPHPLWALPCLFVTFLSFALAYRLTKHAYIILTPLGVEIFPFYQPSKGMRAIFWNEIHAVDIDPPMTWLTLHYNPEQSSGVRLSLRPIRKNLRPLLSQAVKRRLNA